MGGEYKIRIIVTDCDHEKVLVTTYESTDGYEMGEAMERVIVDAINEYEKEMHIEDWRDDGEQLRPRFEG